MSDIEFKQGASGILSIAHDVDNVAITGITAAKYEIYGRTGTVLLTKALGSGIDFVDGKIQIALTNEDTAALSGSYTHQCVARDNANRIIYPLKGEIKFDGTKARL